MSTAKNLSQIANDAAKIAALTTVPSTWGDGQAVRDAVAMVRAAEQLLEGAVMDARPYAYVERTRATNDIERAQELVLDIREILTKS